MSRFTALAASGFLASAMMAAPAFADDTLGQEYPTLDRTTIYQGEPCPAGVNCGPAAELSNVKPFYETVASAPAPVAPQPATAVVQTAQATAAAPVAPVPFSAAGLSNGALAFGAIGAAALVGLIAVAANDDDDNNTASTTN